MARSYAQIKLTIWRDPAFLDLSYGAQRLYMLLLSQPDISYAGVVPYMPTRWARMAQNTDLDMVEGWLCELEEADARFVVVDRRTEEVWVRSFVKNNGVLAMPQLAKAMRKDYEAMLSPVLRWQFFSALDDDEKAQVSTPPEPCPQGDSNRARTVPEGWRSGPVQEQDLDLNLQREQERHPAPVAGPSTSADLLAPGRDPSLLIELDGIVANLVDLHGSERVEAAMQRLTDDRRRFPWPSDARKALEAILGVAPLEAKAHPLDEAQRAQRDMAERDQDAWLRTLKEANAAIPADPAARSEVLAKTRAKLQGKSA